MMQPSRELSDLLTLMQRLRTECPWDNKQTRASLTPYLLEEAYEAAEALQGGDVHEIKDELGDVLFQVVFHAQVAKEAAEFDMGAIIYGLMEKLIRRHPHVFADQSSLSTDQVEAQWQQIKQSEKRVSLERKQAAAAALGQVFEPPARSVFKVKPASALTQAQSLQTQASKMGFDWSDAKSALVKLREEIDELEAEIDQLKPNQPLTPVHRSLNHPNAHTRADQPNTERSVEIEKTKGSVDLMKAEGSADPLKAEGSVDPLKAEGSADQLGARLIDEMGDVLFSSVNVARKLGLDAEQVTFAANQKFNRRMNAVDDHLKTQASSLAQAELTQMQAAWDAIKQDEPARRG